ncbi:MAG: toll/interleukin-1 receptor domain-containing protein, partial [Methylococcales bacterium]|nr:toll/interleukin-1 receptor domain-containing protein [Methylococcales bacterium]
MTKNIFISYSRREVGFVDGLADHLEKEQFDVWLDYRSLVPGKPWKEQIDQGIANSEIILLVVSKASIASQNVEMEWRQV